MEKCKHFYIYKGKQKAAPGILIKHKNFFDETYVTTITFCSQYEIKTVLTSYLNKNM